MHKHLQYYNEPPPCACMPSYKRVNAFISNTYRQYQTVLINQNENKCKQDSKYLTHLKAITTNQITTIILLLYILLSLYYLTT